MKSFDNATASLANFDPRSGSVVERTLFNHRLWVLLVCVLTTLVLGYQATRIELNASFEKMIPTQQPYIANYLEHQKQLTGLGNALRIVVANRQGSIYDAEYLKTLQALSDKLYLLPGVDRAYMKSLWTPATRWVAVTEDGLDGGPVIPDDYSGSAANLEAFKRNVQRSNELGQLVAFDQTSSIIYVPLLAKGPDGVPLDYGRLATQLEELRTKYEAKGVTVHLTGFAKLVGEKVRAAIGPDKLMILRLSQDGVDDFMGAWPGGVTYAEAVGAALADSAYDALHWASFNWQDNRDPNDATPMPVVLKRASGKPVITNGGIAEGAQAEAGEQRSEAGQQHEAISI